MAAQRVATHYKAREHQIVTLDTELFRNSALTDVNLDVPEFKEGSEIPVTYVPARNTIFLAMALGFAESIGARDIFIGASSVDYSHYPDCRPEFISAFQTLANLATKAGVGGILSRFMPPTVFKQSANHPTWNKPRRRL